MDVDALREVLAQAVADAGLPCSAYPPDSPSLPGAWVDALTFDYLSPMSFCESAEASATIVTAAQRNDRAGGLQLLESLIPDIVKNLESSGPVRVSGVESGTSQIGTVDVPAVLYRCTATVAS